MQVGINYPWIHYGWDFGVPPSNGATPWGVRAEWHTRLRNDLETFRRLGIFAVRWWILGDGLLYGTGTDAPQQSGSGSPTWSVPTVPTIPATIVDDFAAALPYFRGANLKVMPVFADYLMFLDGTSPVSGYIKGGRRELIDNPVKRNLFLQNALQPLLRACRGNEDLIYAWDLCNEPEWCVRNPGAGVPSGRAPTLDLAAMLAFLRDGVAMINRAGFRSSIGFAAHATVSAWRSIDLQVRLHQFHYYPHSEILPRHTFHPDYPLIVGEFASAPHRNWPELASSERANPSSLVLGRLRHIESKGYPAAFIWSAETRPAPPAPGEPSPVAWDATTRAQIQSFTGYRGP